MDVKYVNREISWLRFNARVLQEVADPNVPLLERLRFLGIYSNNLDEFYSVRYSALLRSIQLKSHGYRNIIENQTDEQLIEEINHIVAIQREEYDRLYDEIFEELKKENIFIVDDQSLLPEHISFIDNYFNFELSHSIGVYVLNEYLKAPPLRDGAFYLAVKLKTASKAKYALVDIPTYIFPRFLTLPPIGEKNYVIYFEDIIRYYLKVIFKIFKFDSIEAHSVKITRDSELDMDNDLEHSLLEQVALSLEGRRKGEPVRLVYDREIAADTLDFLLQKLNIDDYDSINPGGKYHNKRDLMDFPDLGRTDLKYEKIKPILVHDLEKHRSYLKAISEKDHLIYAPYHDYLSFLRFIREIAIDPKVTKIKITVYRVAKESQIMRALINAARNGKDVTAILELRARFDEENNVKWSKRLQEAGVRVIFGVPGLKVHSKIGYVERLPEAKKASEFAFVSTGNFHAGTAKTYSDYTLLTSDPEITGEIKQVFSFFEANYKVHNYKHLLLSPLHTRKKFIKFIKQEIKNHRKGLPSGINLKLNSLSDKEIIDLLYEASQQGVKIRMVVRGIHCLIPGIEGLSENIESVSVVDKFLEHPRIYWFKNAGEDRIFISSADIMERSLDYRVEVACPVYDKDLKQILMDTFDLSFNDNFKARIHDADLSMEYRAPQEPSIRSQFATYDYLNNLNRIDENKEVSRH